MKTRVLTLSVLFVLLIAAAVTAQDSDLPRVVVLATGGTIAGAAETGTTAGYQSGQVGVEILLAAVPELAKL
ncbi:MAG: L-asparaginase 2, partial [bacterium]